MVLLMVPVKVSPRGNIITHFVLAVLLIGAYLLETMLLMEECGALIN